MNSQEEVAAEEDLPFPEGEGAAAAVEEEQAYLLLLVEVVFQLLLVDKFVVYVGERLTRERRSK